MRTRHRGNVIGGLGALLALGLAGCEPGALRSPMTPGAMPLVREMRPLSSSVQMMRPRRVETFSAVQPASAVSTPAPAVRQAEARSAPGAVVASSWRPMARAPRVIQRPLSAEGMPSPTAYAPPPGPRRGILSPPAELRVATQEGEKLTMPRESAPAAKSEVVVLHPHGAPHGHPHGDLADGPSAPREGNKLALPPYVVEPPDVLLIEYAAKTQGFETLSGQFLVRPDGTLSLGVYGTIRAGGLTIEQIREAVTDRVHLRFDKEKREKIRENVVVDVLAYNSKFYYVVTDGAGYGEAVYRFPVTGSETVLDALAQVGGLPPVGSKMKVWVARANLGHPGGHNVLPVDYISMTQTGAKETNYQLAPGDRVYVHSQKILRADSLLAKIYSPIERTLGVILLGSQTVNSIKGRGGFGGSGFNNP